MKILLVSDIHGNKTIFERVLNFHPDADVYVSLGDSELPYDYLLNKRIHAVKGNYPFDGGVGYDSILVLAEKRFLFTHGHRHGVRRDLKELYKFALHHKIDIACFGHTHIATAKKIGSIVLVNPGSINRPRNHMPPTFMIVNIEEDTVSYEFRNAMTNEVVSIS